jgi:cytochrome bd-type quinol oxidase subunit 2
VADASLAAAARGRRQQRAPAHASARSARVSAAIAVATIVASYGWLAIDHGTLALWSVVVHESGRYTFGGTILYYGHFLREVPVAVAYALFLLAAAGSVEAQRSRAGAAPPALWFGAALALVLTAFALAALAGGWHSAALDLLQQRTRDDTAGYGTHWRYHWLSTLWFGTTVTAAPWLLQRFGVTPALRRSRNFTRAAWAYFAALTMVFGVSAAVFVDPQYAGHQAREILTHALITLPLGIALLLRAADRGERRAPRLDGWTALALALVVAIPVLLGAVALSGGVMEHGQAEHGLGAMVAAHYFEHTLDYLLVLLLLAGGLALQRSARSEQ